MPAWSPSLNRRAALAGSLLGAGALAGCRLDGGAGTGSSGSPAAESPDRELMRRVEVQLDNLIAVVSGIGAAFVPLRPAMQSLEDLHVTHRQSLADGLGESSGSPSPTDSATPSATAGITPAPSAAPSIPAERVEALALLRVRERGAQAFLVEAAVSAQDGALAQLLASMAAAIGQRLALGLGRVPEVATP